MIKRHKLLIGFFCALLGLIVIEFYIYINYGRLTKDITKLSFVVSGENVEEWENMLSGAEAAANDKDCIIDFVNSPKDAGAEGEIELINRQLKDGANYVFVVSGFYEEVYDYVESNSLLGKVAFVKNGDFALKSKGVVTDDYSLGIDFANYILTTDDNSILIAYSDDSINNRNAITGIQEIFDNYGIDVTVKCFGNLDTISDDIVLEEKNGKYDGVIALDSPVIDAFALSQSAVFGGVNIYVVDNRKESVYYLDTSKITALAYKDDYAIGFITVQNYLEGSTVSVKSKDIPIYYIVDMDLLYSEKLEKVLFPFVK